tara:strand:- start:6082 stop:6312 length:231 start_codon:yes stop_codon:yes gene_type:complete
MALNDEQLNNVEFQTAIDASRHANQLEIQTRAAKLEAIRIAKEIVMENHRTVPSGTAIAAGDITTIAEAFETFLTA